MKQSRKWKLGLYLLVFMGYIATRSAFNMSSEWEKLKKSWDAWSNWSDHRYQQYSLGRGRLLPQMKVAQVDEVLRMYKERLQLFKSAMNGHFKSVRNQKFPNPKVPQRGDIGYVDFYSKEDTTSFQIL